MEGESLRRACEHGANEAISGTRNSPFASPTPPKIKIKNRWKIIFR